ncbi:protein kintoun [Gastrophryne carolinensis]
MAASKLEELNVTADELERFRSAFQDPAFRQLFAQYAEELRDPNTRQRYERDIADMERERGVDVRFLHPVPGHVLHTSLDGRRSCYVNVCSSELVGRPRGVHGTDGRGRPGQHWSLPCSFSPAREELSAEGEREVIYDVIFHPDTLLLADESDKFKAMVDQTALDTVAQHFHVVLDTANARTLEKEKYRGVPQSTVLRKPRPGAQPKPQDPSDPLSFPYPYDAPGGAKNTKEPTVPHYTIRHRSYVDIQDYRDARDAAPSPVPKELVITVDLPLLTSASGVALNIEGKELSLESQKPAYRLQLSLPYLVQEEQGSAQFNKIKRQLVVTVPVVQQNVPQLIPDLQAEPDPPESQPPGMCESSTVKPEAEEPTPAVAPECPLFTCSQDATSLTLVIHVKDVDEHSVTSEVGSYQCEIRFRVRPTNAPHVLYVEFLPQYNLNTSDLAVRVSQHNAVIELTKSSECFGLWKNLYFGVDSNSLQERRFINEDNVAEFLESGLRPSTIPWSTLEDEPLINVLEMNPDRARIRLNKPEAREERYLAHREQYIDLSKVKKKISYDDTGAELPLQDSPAPEQPTSRVPPPAVSNQHKDSSAEDEGLLFKDIATSNLDEDDLPDSTRESSAPHACQPSPALREVDAKDGGVTVTSDHKTQCAFRFDNALLYDLD